MRRSVVVVALLWAGVAGAHHSAAMFDLTQCRSLTGTVRSVQWTYPHSWIWVNVIAGKDELQTWAFEGAEPLLMARFGWSRDAIKVGDKITVRFSPLRDGRRGGQWAHILTAAGRTIIGQPLACNGEAGREFQGGK